ncbi:DUF3422 family protein [Methylocella silvestris]|uniref:DUF3422 family protein n=1 Tax=Methylocella silvestris TaxID=199596 RepID=UPI001FDEE618|nr:DUF3422 domain-containing protein [Methylocella silvestris]
MIDETTSSDIGFREHALRSRVLAEVHARPFESMAGAKRILHFAFMTDYEEAERAQAALAQFCLDRAAPPPLAGARRHRVELAPTVLRWERHGEFLTYTWEFSQENGGDPERTAFRPGAGELAKIMRMLPQPGPLIVAVDLDVLPEARLGDGWMRLFGQAELAAAEVSHGAAIVATDFRADVYGFVRILVLDRNLTELEAGALAQRLLELETYRTLALLGLPRAQDLSPSISRIEAELPRLIAQMSDSEGLEASRQLLGRLNALAAELETGAAQSLYRFGATKAYHEVVELRLKAIGEHAIGDIPTLAAFLSRRLTPAIRTVGAIEARQDTLSQKLARAAQLLRTRVEVELESQNQNLLRTMNERVRMQLRLQQTVEGLSVAAITYYISSIVHLMLEGAHQQEHELNPALATAIAVPFIAGFVWWNVRRLRERHPVD